MNSNMIQVSPDAIKAISLHGDYSKLSEADRLSVVLSICDQLNLNPALNPFNYIPNKDGKIMLYPNKSCSAQLASNRKLKCEVVSEGVALESVYEVKCRVTEGERVTEDVGAVAITYWKKGDNGQPGSWARLEGSGIADAIKKAHTQAKRRTILAHCGLGLPDGQEEEPLVVLDTPVNVKDVPKDEPKHQELPAPKPQKDKWRGMFDRVDSLESNGKPVWAFIGTDGQEFKTADPVFTENGIEKGREYEVTFKTNGKGTRIIEKLKEVKS